MKRSSKSRSTAEQNNSNAKVRRPRSPVKKRTRVEKKRPISAISKSRKSLLVPQTLPPTKSPLTVVQKPSNKMAVVTQALLANIKDLRGMVWQRLCTMMLSCEESSTTHQSECRLSFIDAYIRTTSNLESNLNEMNRSYLKQLVQLRREENDEMFLEITQELFRLHRLFSTASKTGRIVVSSSGRAKDAKDGRTSRDNRVLRVNSNAVGEVAVRDMEELGSLLDSFFHGEPQAIDSIPDHCFWMRRNILLRCSARQATFKKPKVLLASRS